MNINRKVVQKLELIEFPGEPVSRRDLKEILLNNFDHDRIHLLSYFYVNSPKGKQFHITISQLNFFLL